MTASGVSVIIPAYNAEAFLGETLRSVLAQTVPVLEVLVVDDESTDGTAEVAASFGPPVRLLRQANGGAARARNAGAALASGTWLAFLDADDRWLPHKLERQLAMASPDVALVYSDRANIGATDGLPRVQGELQPMVDGDAFVSLLRDGNVITTSSVLVRREVFEAVGGFDLDTRLLPAEDWDLWLRIAARHRIACAREPLVEYRLHAGGVSRHTMRMLYARELVVARALAAPRGRALPAGTQRRIIAETHRTNAWDAARGGLRGRAVRDYLRALGAAPLHRPAWAGLVRLALGRE